MKEKENPDREPSSRGILGMINVTSHTRRKEKMNSSINDIGITG